MTTEQRNLLINFRQPDYAIPEEFNLIKVVSRIRGVFLPYYNLGEHEYKVMTDLRNGVMASYMAINSTQVFDRCVDFINTYNIIIQPLINESIQNTRTSGTEFQPEMP